MSTETPLTDAAEALYHKWRLGTKSLSSTPEQRKFTIESIVPDGERAAGCAESGIGGPLRNAG